MKTKILIFVMGFLLTCVFNVEAQDKANDVKTITPASRTEPLKVGATAPDFTLNDQNGKPITLSKARSPVVLVFYRGYW